ncbi:hypothetical protein CDL12_18594 [Handroanthus impetiginosus]|uniref:Prolamin-like domain-containing protein n=1 Tax=Handroanthus impetiginosus TaxID=429701 RepID=A0A2G9GU86_9LAMI|nr:hypothetical protein CDL12_18594 [Handroanthus impetiginosus]
MIPKIIIFLIINLFILNKSEAKSHKNPLPNVPSPAPTSDQPKPEKYTPQYKKFLQACQKRIEDECTDEIARNLIRHEKVSKNCCSQLVNMGPDCHRALIYAEKRVTKGKNREKIVSESEDLYKKCEKMVPRRPKAYPKLPARKYRPDYEEYLQHCGKKITETCGEEVVYAIIGKNKTVNKGCCKKLLYMGKECHEEFVEGLERLAGYNKGRHEDKVNGKKVWRHCEKAVGHK